MANLDLLKDIAEAVMATAKTKRTEAYDTPAQVVRVEGSTAWVHIPGGVDETPVKLTISVKVGDTVQVRVGGGTAWIVGNATAPPTDDTAAKKAEKKAEEASGVATNFVTDTQDGIFVHPKDNKSDGVRITDAIEIIKGGLSFIRAYVEDGIAKVRVGRADSGHSVIDSAGMRIFGGENGSEELANIGYGTGTALIGTEPAPYYSLGERRTGTPGIYSMAEGRDSEASGPYAHAEGSGCSAEAQSSHAEGLQTTSSNVGTHSEGDSTTASGWASHAEGSETTSSGYGSHSEGVQTTASTRGAHAEGVETTASARAAHAGGIGNTAAYEAQTVIGKYASAPSSDDLLLVGNGSDNSTRSNAMRLKDTGRVEFAGAVGSGLSWTTRTEMITAMTSLSLNKPYVFYAGATWTNTAGAGSYDAFGVICKMSTTSWHILFMANGILYKSVYNNSTQTFNTTLIG